MGFQIIAQSSGPAVDFILSDYYNELADVCFDLFDTFMIFSYVLGFAGLLFHAYKVGFGDITGVFRAMITMGIVFATIPFFPDLIFGAQELLGYTLLQELGLDPISIVTDGVTDIFDGFMGNFTGGSTFDTILNIISLEFIFDTLIHMCSQIIFAIVAIVGWLLMLLGFLVQIVALYMGVAVSPLFVSMLLFENTRETGVKYITGLIAICFWPLGWGLGMIVAKALITANFFDSLPVAAAASYIQPWIDLAVGIVALVWMIIVVLKTPKIISAAITTGSQIGAGFTAEAVGTATSVAGSVITVAAAAGAAAVTGGAGGAAAAAAIKGGGAAVGGAVSNAGK